MATFDLYRFTHPDGSAKDWAIRRNSDGSLTTRWGPTGPVLPQASTRRGDKIRLEASKQREGYVPLGAVDIDLEGRVRFVAPAPEPDPAPNPSSPDAAVYWRLTVAEAAKPSDLRAWRRNLAAAVDRLAAIVELDWTPGRDFAPGTVQGWPLPATGTTGAGQLRQTQGPIPLLILLTMKALAPAGARLALAAEDSREIGTDLRAESRLLAEFGTDLDTVRPWAEALGLLQPRLNLAIAIQSEGDAWF